MSSPRGSAPSPTRTRGNARTAAAAAGGLALAGVGTAAWSMLVEPRAFALRRVELAVLDHGAWPIRVLHLSDLHIVPGHRHKIDWVSALADLRPDLVINTGDTLSHLKAVPTALAAFGGLLDLPGAFVFGNNDFYAPVPKSPHNYFLPKNRVPRRGPGLPWQDLRAGMAERGWIDLNNVRTTIELRGQRVALAGVNDPYTRRDHYELIEGPAETDAVLRLGVTHTPEPRVLDRFALDGYDLILAGHTHGGQVRIPGVGAVVTNCDLDRSRARGVSRWGSHTMLNVSAGLGTSPYMPMRLCCRPEATLLTLRARPA